MKADIINRFLTTDISYTYIDPVDLDQNTVLKFRPRNLFYASLIAQHWQWQVELNYRYVSRVEAIDENLVRLAPIVDGEYRVASNVVDAGITYNLTSLGLPLNIGLTIKNLTNYYYVELLGNLAPVQDVLRRSGKCILKTSALLQFNGKNPVVADHLQGSFTSVLSAGYDAAYVPDNPRQYIR